MCTLLPPWASGCSRVGRKCHGLHSPGWSHEAGSVLVWGSTEETGRVRDPATPLGWAGGSPLFRDTGDSTVHPAGTALGRNANDKCTCSSARVSLSRTFHENPGSQTSGDVEWWPEPYHLHTRLKGSRPKPLHLPGHTTAIGDGAWCGHARPRLLPPPLTRSQKISTLKSMGIKYTSRQFQFPSAIDFRVYCLSAA